VENVLIFAQEQFVLVISLAALIFLFIRNETAKGGEKLSCPQVVQALNAGDSLLLDVRDSKEFDAGHIVDSMNIPHAKVADSLKKLEKYKTKQIIVVDKIGQHSGPVVKLLTEKGFNVVRLGGGIGEWKQENLPLIKE
jgi:rhodanese-related sulfurtransferase